MKGPLLFMSWFAGVWAGLIGWAWATDLGVAESGAIPLIGGFLWTAIVLLVAAGSEEKS